MNQHDRDVEFARVWREQGGDYGRAATILGVGNNRPLRIRKNGVERRLGVILPVVDPVGRPAYNTASSLVSESRAVKQLSVKDGVVLVCSDAHIWPGPLSTMQRAFLYFAEHYSPRPVAIIANGDMFDGARISRHPSIGWEQTPELRDELTAVQAYMTALAGFAKGMRRLWPCGNHDMRFESRLAMVAPEYRGVKGIHLKDHFPEWEPCWRVDINSDVIVRHREQGGEHADWNNVVKSGKTIVTGHDHRTGVVPYRDYTGLRYGVRCGFLGDSALDPQFVNYLEAREPNWHPAFVVLTFVGGRLLMPELCLRMDETTVMYRGNLIAV